MAAEKGNRFWELRSKSGIDKLFKTPEVLWEAACEYFQWCDDNPWIKKEPIKSGDMAGKTMEVATARPYTLQRLCLYLGCSTNYFRQFKSADRKNKEDFVTVITRIEETIYSQKFEGAAVGAFNANIIARDLGLREQSENKNTNINANVPLTTDRARELAEVLRSKYGGNDNGTGG